jgi:hypothetical protein
MGRREMLQQLNAANEQTRGETSTENTSIADFSNREKIEIPEKKKATSRPKKREKKRNDDEEIMQHLSLQPEENEYLQFKAARIGKTIKVFFDELIKNEMKDIRKNGVDFKDPEVRKYMYGKLEGKTPKTISISPELEKEIEEGAKLCLMKKTNFISYCIYRARIKDKNWVSTL